MMRQNEAGGCWDRVSLERGRLQSLQPRDEIPKPHATRSKGTSVSGEWREGDATQVSTQTKVMEGNIVIGALIGLGALIVVIVVGALIVPLVVIVDGILIVVVLNPRIVQVAGCPLS
eukprot:Selendium_serpulae@DN7115_c0_g1_i1.p1